MVNTASRIQGAAPIDGVAVSEETQRQTERIFVYEPLPSVSLKGKAQRGSAVPRSRSAGSVRRDLIRTHDSPFVGRVAERALLTSLFDRCARDSQPQLVTLFGEPGAGKSRLCAELFAHIDERPELITWRQGRCLPYGDGITFWALGEIVKAQAGIFDTDSPDAATDKLDGALPDLEERPFLRARLLPLVGIDPGVATTRDESFSAWRTFIEWIAAQGPAVLVFEDLHWADAALLDFIAYLAEWAEGVPLLLVCTARPELIEATPDVGQWPPQRAHAQPLAVDDRRVQRARCGRCSLAPSSPPICARRSSSVPVGIRCTPRSSSGSSLNVVIGDVAEFPDNVHALIAARLDTLSASRKSLMQDASVVGKVFWSGALAEISGRTRQDVEHDLHELSRKELVRPARVSSMEGEIEFAFWHALVRDVAYAQIPRVERRRRHEAVAAWIEAKAGTRVEDFAEVLAHHYLTAMELTHRSPGTPARPGSHAPSRIAQDSTFEWPPTGPSAWT